MEGNPVNILINARKKRGYTQSVMAEKLGIGLRMYQKIEAGNWPKLKKDQIRKMDEILDTNVYELIYESDVPRETGRRQSISVDSDFLDSRAALINL